MMWFIWTILIGAIVGWLAGQLVSGRGFGFWVDVLVGIVGSFLGHWLFGIMGITSMGSFGGFIISVIGAVVLVLIIKAIKKA
ncbi:MAG: GlsB/YeaQ/YmgE family stress response membrane protein [Candidatus Acidiferrales bacterium]